MTQIIDSYEEFIKKINILYVEDENDIITPPIN